MRYIFLDTETTGLDPNKGDRIVEIGCVEMLERNISKTTFHAYLNPQRNMPIEAFNVHGLSEEFLSDKSLFKNVANDFIKFIQGASIIIHNASFDVGFLDAELNKAGLLPFNSYVFEIIDSLKYARKLYPGKRNSLDALCDRLEIDRSNRDYHGALLDCNLLANVWLAMTRGQDELLTIVNKNNADKIEVITTLNINVEDSNIIIKATDIELEQHLKILESIKSVAW